jgi:hypothetical protein
MGWIKPKNCLTLLSLKKGREQGYSFKPPTVYGSVYVSAAECLGVSHIWGGCNCACVKVEPVNLHKPATP